MNILISACLCGCTCRYDGKNKNSIDLSKLDGHNLFPVCPEVDGGLSIPRAPAERVGPYIITNEGNDVTEQYKRGAEIALKTALENGCTVAILKARSPSCGKGEIYDGSFTHTVIEGNGVTTELLEANRIKVFTEKDFDTSNLF
ncbi:MAG: DUF523 domain-containing protein [Clostridia bacterium]|nr:DUF523 domain-containing protein [Clostridia bacterium]